jgi:hypothetical protein
MKASEFSIPEIGINVRSDGNIDYADLIVDGEKKLETRNSDSLRPYVGKRVSIVKTGKGRAYAIGVATVGEPIEVDEGQFRKLEKQHLVPAGSKFDIVPGSTKFLYPMINAKRYERPREVGHGIVSRKVFVEDDDTPKNLAWRIRFKRFSDMDSFLPEREGKMYFMPFDTSALGTFSNLTGKDYEKISKMPTEVYEIPSDAMVYDMKIINSVNNAINYAKKEKNPERKKQYEKMIDYHKKQYLDSGVPYSQYQDGMFDYPEILVDPSKVRKIEDRGVTYDKNTGEIKLTKRKAVNEKWSEKYKRSINCNNPKGFSQRAHCQGRKKK